MRLYALRRGSDLPWAAALAAVLLAALTLRLHQLQAHGLWLDEIYGATYTGMGPIDTVVAVWRFDIHPPLYYLQLNAWAALFGGADASLLINSVVCSGAVVLCMGVIAWRRLGPAAAVATAALLAAALNEVVYAQEVRMYAFFSLLVIAGWWAAERSAAQPPGPGCAARDLLLAAMACMVALTHGASVIAVSALGLFWLARLHAAQALGSRRVLRVAALAGPVLLLVMINSALRSIGHTQAFSLAAALGTASRWLWGDLGATGAAAWAWSAAAGLLLLAAFVHACTRPGWLRATALCLVAWPLTLGALLSLAVRPIWLDRTFAFCGPFALLLVGAMFGAAWEGMRRQGPRLMLACALLLAVAAGVRSSLLYLHAPRKMEYREAAQLLRSETVPGDLIYVPDRPTFWAMAHYLVGPGWGSALAVQDPERSDKSDVWPRVYAKLGPQWVQRLGLRGDRRELPWQDRLLLIGPSPAPALQSARHVWLVAPAGAKDLDQLALPCAPGQHPPRLFRGIKVIEIRC